MTDSDTHPSESIKKLDELIKNIQVAMLTTVRADGSLHSRPMVTQETPFDGTLWFFTEAGSPKTDEILDDQHVNVSYSDPAEQRYVSVSGVARIVRDPALARELWTSLHKAWFPQGPDDPSLVLLRVDAQEAEYWDGPASRVVQLIGMVKAMATGRRYEPGESHRIDLQGERADSGKRYEPQTQDWPKGEGPPVKGSSPAPWPRADKPIK